MCGIDRPWILNFSSTHSLVTWFGVLESLFTKIMTPYKLLQAQAKWSYKVNHVPKSSDNLEKLLVHNTFHIISKVISKIWPVFIVMGCVKSCQSFKLLNHSVIGPEFIKNCWKNERLFFSDVFSKPPRKACYQCKSCKFTLVAYLSSRFRKNIRKKNRSFFHQFLMIFYSGPKSEQFKSLKLWHYFTPPMTINMSQIFYFTLLIMWKLLWTNIFSKLSLDFGTKFYLVASFCPSL